MNPVLISIGPFSVTWYGLLIVAGAVLGAWVATIEAKRRGEDPEHVWNVLPWLLIAGIIGARLYHVFSNPVGGLGWSWYREHPLDIINFWSGGFRGLGIFGAVLGGFLALILYFVFRERGRRTRLAQATSLLKRFEAQLGSGFVKELLAADISTIPGLEVQRARVAALREKIEQTPEWSGAQLFDVADVLAQREPGLLKFLQRDFPARLKQSKALLASSQQMVGGDIADALMKGDVSSAAGRESQKANVEQLKQRLRQNGVLDYQALHRLAPVFAERRLIVPRWLDIVIPGVLLAQALGRFGNFINQELYGPPTTLPWGFKINTNFPFQTPTEMLGRSPQEILEYVTVTRFHPTFFYESLWNITGFTLVMVLGRRWYHRLRDGDVFLFYLIWYPTGRLIVEMFRPDAWVSGLPGLATAQLISLVMIAAGVIGLILRHRNWKPAPVAAAVPVETSLEANNESQ